MARNIVDIKTVVRAILMADLWTGLIKSLFSGIFFQKNNRTHVRNIHRNEWK
jgi:hypothetical protein